MKVLPKAGAPEDTAGICARLRAGENVLVATHGMSMWPIYRSGMRIFIEPCEVDELEQGDVVLVKVSDQLYLHRVIGRLGLGIITKGDARRRKDGVIPPERVLGRAPKRRSDAFMGQMSGVLGTPLWIIANIYRQFFDRIQGRP